MKISVIIPTYNRSELLGETIKSIVEQNFSAQDYELIVVDNNSTDQTKEVVGAQQTLYPDHQIVYLKEEQQGAGIARNTGTTKALSDNLLFTDDDIIACPDWIQKIYEVFESNSKIIAVGGKISLKWDIPPAKWVNKYEHLHSALNYGDELIIANDVYLHGGNFAIKKKVLIELGGYPIDKVKDEVFENGENNLNRQLKELDGLMAWAPQAEVWHCQFLEQHGSLEGMQKRFKHFARIDVYDACEESSCPALMLLKNLLVKSMTLIKRFLLNRSSEEDQAKLSYYTSYIHTCLIQIIRKILWKAKARSHEK